MDTQFFKTRSDEIDQSLPFTRGNSFAGIPRQISNSKIEAQAEKIERYARVSHHVLLTGERGTGKTTVARQIHERSQRRHKPFVSLNCATLQAELVEAELFGYEKGAFTGANQMKAGLFEVGSSGTIFLDEVGELSLSLQAKLLKAVEEKRIRRVGASVEITIDLRIIAATSRDLREMTRRGEFRADLYDRLNVLSIGMIPLREQKEKIRELVFAGLEQERVALGRKNCFQIETSAYPLLEDYAWTGNFRELKNFVLKLTTEHADTEIITAKEIRTLLAEKEIAENKPGGGVQNLAADNSLFIEINPDEPLHQIIERVKERYVRHHLKDKSIRRAAGHCGIARSMIARIASKFEANGTYQSNL
jgi:transcriptional regulator with PAS, ATPase and Fis domain